MVPGHSAPTRVFVHLPTHPLRAAELQELALGPRPNRPDKGICSCPNRPTAGRRAAGVGPWSLAIAPRPGSSFICEPSHWHRVGLQKNPRWKPAITLSIGVYDHIALVNCSHLQVPIRPRPCGLRKKPQPLTIMTRPAADGPASSMAPTGHRGGSPDETGPPSSPQPGRVECPTCARGHLLQAAGKAHGNMLPRCRPSPWTCSTEPFMYTQEGSRKCTREDGGAIVWYCKVVSALWDRIKEHEQLSGKQGGRRGAIAGHPMSV